MPAQLDSPPRVTICMPARNAEATLARAIASVRAQTVRDWRLVVADDASTDGTCSIAQAAAAADPRVTAVRHADRRIFMNFRTGLDSADTPFFVWLAADDYWAPRFLDATLAALAVAPAAVSALPRARFTGISHDEPPPKTSTLDGPTEDRIRRFLAAPGGTRMYGLMRTEVVRAHFPPRNMNAWDWYLMTGILRYGPQVEVPEVLLFRELTDLPRYAEMVDELHRFPLFRRFPVLAMSLAAVWAGHVRRGNIRDLAALNLRKHEEYLATMRPSAFARRIVLFRRLGLPISSRPGSGARIAEQVARTAPGRRAGAIRMLATLARAGDDGAALRLGHLRREGLASGDARVAYREAGALGNADGWFHDACLGGDPADLETWTRILAAAQRGSRAARDHLAAETRRGAIPAPVAKAVAYALARFPKTPGPQ
jgi:glycosyltransferase involved in cell wall biosynthesis